MKIKLKIKDIRDEDQEYFAELIKSIIDVMVEHESNDNKVDSVLIMFQDGSEEEIR